jgi:hypothetical protein
MVLRCTRRMLDLLGGRALRLTDLPPADDDWYLNLLWLDRRKCLLLTHAETLFSVFRAGVRAADLRPLGPYVVRAVEAELRSERLPPATFDQLDPDAVRLAKTASRSTLGFMNGMAVHLRYRSLVPEASATATSTRSTITSAAPCTTAADTSTRSSSLPSGLLRAPDPATKADSPTNPGRRTSLRTLRAKSHH